MWLHKQPTHAHLWWRGFPVTPIKHGSYLPGCSEHFSLNVSALPTFFSPVLPPPHWVNMMCWFPGPWPNLSLGQPWMEGGAPRGPRRVSVWLTVLQGSGLRVHYVLKEEGSSRLLVCKLRRLVLPHTAGKKVQWEKDVKGVSNLCNGLFLWTPRACFTETFSSLLCAYLHPWFLSTAPP